jgi:methanogenic corrinoid protein MtbC1
MQDALVQYSGREQIYEQIRQCTGADAYGRDATVAVALAKRLIKEESHV